VSEWKKGKKEKKKKREIGILLFFSAYEYIIRDKNLDLMCWYEIRERKKRTKKIRDARRYEDGC